MVVTLKNDNRSGNTDNTRRKCQEMLRARALSAATIEKADGMVDDAVVEPKPKKLKLQPTEGSSISRIYGAGQKVHQW